MTSESNYKFVILVKGEVHRFAGAVPLFHKPSLALDIITDFEWPQKVEIKKVIQTITFMED